MDTVLKDKWIQLLGELKQGFGYLRHGDCFCVMGAFCEAVRQVRGVGSWEKDESGTDCFKVETQRAYCVIPYQFDCEFEPFREKFRAKYDVSLMGLNDREHRSFAEIAEFIASVGE